MKNKIKLIIGVLGIVVVLLLIFIMLKLSNDNLTDMKDIPIIYQKNDQFYMDSVDKEPILLPSDILEVKYVTNSGTIYYEDTDHNLCIYDKKLNKSVLDLPELFSLGAYNLNVTKLKKNNSKILNFSLSESGLEFIRKSNVVEDIDCPIYLIDDDNKASLISNNAELIAITNDDKVLFKDSNNDLLVYSDGEASILDKNVYNITIWSKAYDKLIYNKRENSKLALNIYNSKDNSIKEVLKLDNLMKFEKILLLNNDTMSFDVFSLIGKKTTLYVAKINDNIEVDEIESVSGSYDLNPIDLINKSKTYGIQGINYKIGLDRLYYTRAIENSFGIKDDILFYYDINDKKVYKAENIQSNLSFMYQYDDRIAYYNFDNELVEVLHENKTPNIIGVIKNRDNYIYERFNSNTYFYDGDKSFYVNYEIVENDMNIKSFDGMENLLYFTKNKTLNMFSTEDNKIYTLCDDIMSIDKVYLNNEWIDKEELTN